MIVYVDMNQLAESFPFSCSFISRLSELLAILGVEVDHKHLPQQI